MQVEVTTEQVQEAMKFARLPEAKRIQVVGKTWVHSNFRLELAGGHSILLRCRTFNPGWDTLNNEATALRLAPDALPRARDFVILPNAIFGRAAALTTYLPGQDGSAIVESAEGREVLATHIGRTIATLQARTFDRHGTVGLGSSFGNRAATWREEWTLLVEEAWARANAAGIVLGDRGARIMEQIRAGLPSLDGVNRFTLVHRDLHPSNLRVSEKGDLTGVIDWSDAMVGDPTVEWATLAQASPAWFDKIHAAAGRPPLERLPLYAASRVIQHIGFSTLPFFDHDRGGMRALSIERAHLMAQQVLTGDAPSLDPTRIPIRRATEALRHLPGVRPNNTGPWLGGLAGVLLGDDWLEYSSNLVERVDPQEHPRPYGESTRTAVVERVLAGLPDAPEGAFAITAVALVCEADDRLGGTLDTRVWAGLAEAVEGLLRMEQGISLPLQHRGFHALLGRAACKVLGAPAHGDRFGEPAKDVPPRPDQPTQAMDVLIPAFAWAQAQIAS